MESHRICPQNLCICSIYQRQHHSSKAVKHQRLLSNSVLEMGDTSALSLLSFSSSVTRCRIPSIVAADVNVNSNSEKCAPKLIPRCSTPRNRNANGNYRVYSNPRAFPCLVMRLPFQGSISIISTPLNRRGTRRGRRREVCACSGRRGEEYDDFGLYPWDSSTSFPDGLQWVQEDTITFLTSDGLMRIGGSVVPRRINPSDKNQGILGASHRYQRFQEENYMDPNQGLCLGAIFDIAATNGLDLGRRLCIFGFCRSIEMLSDVVEDTVLEQGGEVVASEKESKGGLHEKLTMTVAVPLLWGIPPAADRLHFAVRTGGGIVEKVYWQWDFL